MSHPHSFTGKELITDELQGNLLFSELCGSIKRMNGSHSSAFLSKVRSNPKFPLNCDAETAEALVHLWCINCLTVTKWHKLNRGLRDQLIHDFLDTLYCTSHAFDEIFLLLFTNSKSRSFILGLRDKTVLPSNDLRRLVEDMLRYSSSADLKYHAHSNGVRCQERIADFPLKTFSLCPCTRRPLYVAMYLGRPDVVQLLLKCGARIPYEDVCVCMRGYTRHPLKNVMDVLKVTFDGETDAFLHRTERSVLSLKLIVADLNHCCSLWSDVRVVLQRLNADEDISNIPSLKHICRARIRQILRENRFLFYPHIWNVLCLPNMLIPYMNLDYCNNLDQDDFMQCNTN